MMTSSSGKLWHGNTFALLDLCERNFPIDGGFLLHGANTLLFHMLFAWTIYRSLGDLKRRDAYISLQCTQTWSKLLSHYDITEMWDYSTFEWLDSIIVMPLYEWDCLATHQRYVPLEKLPQFRRQYFQMHFRDIYVESFEFILTIHCNLSPRVQ